jgi:ankyrin repeat protein
MSFGDTGCAEFAILDRLLEFINVNDADADGRIPLHFMVRYLNRINVVRHLISRGANVNAADDKGNTPLHFTVNSSN